MAYVNQSLLQSDKWFLDAWCCSIYWQLPEMMIKMCGIEIHVCIDLIRRAVWLLFWFLRVWDLQHDNGHPCEGSKLVCTLVYWFWCHRDNWIKVFHSRLLIVECKMSKCTDSYPSVLKRKPMIISLLTILAVLSIQLHWGHLTGGLVLHTRSQRMVLSELAIVVPTPYSWAIQGNTPISRFHHLY